MSEEVARRAGDAFLFRWIDRVQPVGITAPTDIFSIEGAAPDRNGTPESLRVRQWQVELCSRWDNAVELYKEKDWQGALEAFEAILADLPQDRPTLAMVERCRHLRDSPPDPAWDGVMRMSTK